MTDINRGYRVLTPEELAMINEVAAQAEVVGALIDRVKNFVPAPDQRWLAIGATELQKGFMAVIRSIAKPDCF